MSAKTKNGSWINRNGNAVNPKLIDPVAKRRDRVVERIIKKAEKLESMMLKVKQEIFNEVETYMNYIQKKSGAEEVDTKGNITLSDYSSLKKVKIQINEMLEFDERLNVAKQLIDECLTEWASDAAEELKAIVAEAFNVDKKGKVNKFMLFRLKKIRVKHPKWTKAMQLIDESTDVVGTRQYLMFQTRESIRDDFRTINLNFSSIKEQK